MIVKNAIRHKVCNSCALENTCGDLPGICMLVNYAQLASVVVMLTYFLLTMDL